MTTTYPRTAFLSALAIGMPFAAASAGTFANISVDGDFSDWDAVPVAVTDPTDGTDIDYASLKIANDSTKLYVLITYATALNPQAGSGNFTVIDSDGDTSTGFDVFSLGQIGSNAAFQNDFPFTQSSTEYNSNGSLSSPSLANLYAASPYGVSTTQQEIAYSLDTVSTDTSAGGFSGLIFDDAFRIGYFSDIGAGDIVVADYTLAPIPEPASLALVSLGAVALLGRRRVG